MFIWKLPLRWIVIAAVPVFFANCAEQRPEEIPQKFERGIKGEGTIYQPTRENDPFIKEKARVGT